MEIFWGLEFLRYGFFFKYSQNVLFLLFKERITVDKYMSMIQNVVARFLTKGLTFES